LNTFPERPLYSSISVHTSQKGDMITSKWRHISCSNVNSPIITITILLLFEKNLSFFLTKHMREKGGEKISVCY
jgi:hypothetical protein